MLHSAKAALAQNAIHRPGGEQGVGVQEPRGCWWAPIPVINGVMGPL